MQSAARALAGCVDSGGFGSLGVWLSQLSAQRSREAASGGAAGLSSRAAPAPGLSPDF